MKKLKYHIDAERAKDTNTTFESRDIERSVGGRGLGERWERYKTYGHSKDFRGKKFEFQKSVSGVN